MASEVGYSSGGDTNSDILAWKAEDLTAGCVLETGGDQGQKLECDGHGGRVPTRITAWRGVDFSHNNSSY